MAVARLALFLFTFSNGVTVPAGTLVSLRLLLSTYEEMYSNPEQLDGFCFSKTRDIGGDIVTTGFSSPVGPDLWAWATRVSHPSH